MISISPTIQNVRAALALPDFDVEGAWRRMFTRPGLPRTLPPDLSKVRQAGVLALLYPALAGGLVLALIRRTPDPGVHSGQIGFPGGAHEPGDSDATITALREACEEVGVCGPVCILGQLTPVYIPPSGFLVTPTVGWVPARPVFAPSPDEVAELIELPLPSLLDDSRKREEDWVLAGYDVRVPFYDVSGHKVWGATALMLSELEMRLRAVLGM
ncbi:MAG: CoA pyrophosphatase [Anaerolineae bacterium]|nr:CoA pyrophosphatase [Anaerolineae bacterium]